METKTGTDERAGEAEDDVVGDDASETAARRIVSVGAGVAATVNAVERSGVDIGKVRVTYSLFTFFTNKN